MEVSFSMQKKQNIFVRSLRELKSTRCLAVTALLIAINLVSLWALPAPGLKKGRPFDPEGTSC